MRGKTFSRKVFPRPPFPKSFILFLMKGEFSFQPQARAVRSKRGAKGTSISVIKARIQKQYRSSFHRYCFLSYRKLRNYSPAVLHNRAYKKAMICGSMVQAACFLLVFPYSTYSLYTCAASEMGCFLLSGAPAFTKIYVLPSSELA